MTTAHRPTFDPARGRETQKGPAFHQRLLPAYTHLKFRQPGQGGQADGGPRDLREQLLAAEAAHFAKKAGVDEQQPKLGEAVKDTTEAPRKPIEGTTATPTAKRQLEYAEDGDVKMAGDDTETEDPAAKRQKVLAATRDIDADSDESASDSSDDSDDDDEEDEAAELMREVEKIRHEREAQKAEEERKQREAEKEQRQGEIARGNPLLNPREPGVKRRWDDDVVFKNQARGTENKGPKEFVNDLLRSDFHKRFMSKYVK